jgi:integrase/recombinase XerD
MPKAYLDPKDVEQLEAQAKYLRDKILIRLLFRLGCRVSEALAIAVEDIDFTRGTVNIVHLKTRINLACPACGARLTRISIYCGQCGIKVDRAIAEQRSYHRMRTLILDEDTLAMIREYIERGGPTLRDGRHLLIEIGRNQAWLSVSRCAREAGLDSLINPTTGKSHGVSPHRLRDAFAVMAMRRDSSTDSVRMLQEQLGHADIGTTMKYRKVAGEELGQWYRKLWEKDDGDRP